ncbi:MAG: SpoIIIAH-like family protein [Clostridia bacterium]|nr:SpoIIIAH-like family protein [Clostridia bacterium]NCC44910.1 SpoIIIAH-like family protein [Clostridia bacterium]
MKKIFKKNQIIITALAVMIAAAGYISYSDSKLKTTDTSAKNTKNETEASDTATDMDSILSDIESLDGDITDETAALEEGSETNSDTADAATDIPGEAVLTGASTYMAQARVDREQIRSQNKETLLEIINNSDLTEQERQSAVASMVSMTDMVEKESAAELLLEAKGFPDVVVNLTGETADIVVPSETVDDASRAQIEDIVKRKTGVPAENIVITPMRGGEEVGEEK